MAKCKKRSVMLREIQRGRSEQFPGTPKAQRLAWSGVQFPGNRIQLFLGEATEIRTLGHVLAQQTVGLLVDAVQPETVLVSKMHLDADCLRQSPAGIISQPQTYVSDRRRWAWIRLRTSRNPLSAVSALVLSIPFSTVKKAVPSTSVPIAERFRAFLMQSPSQSPNLSDTIPPVVQC